jgi:hypothetical protein
MKYKNLKSYSNYVVENSSYSLSTNDMRIIIKSYLECSLFTDEEQLIEEYPDYTPSIDDFSVDAKLSANEDIQKFINLAGRVAITEAIDEIGLVSIGHCIWYGRNGHGAGFFDYTLDNEKVLQDAVIKLKTTYIYYDGNELQFE